MVKHFGRLNFANVGPRFSLYFLARPWKNYFLGCVPGHSFGRTASRTPFVRTWTWGPFVVGVCDLSQPQTPQTPYQGPKEGDFGSRF